MDGVAIQCPPRGNLALLPEPRLDWTDSQDRSRRQIYFSFRAFAAADVPAAWMAARLRLEGEQRMSVATSFAFFLAAPAAGGGSPLTVLLPLLLIPVLYLVMIRPQQKRQKQWQAMLGSIKTGDRVTTAGGIRGIILSIKDDSIIIRVAPDNLKLEVAKSAIASVTTQEGTPAS